MKILNFIHIQKNSKKIIFLYETNMHILIYSPPKEKNNANKKEQYLTIQIIQRAETTNCN